MVDDTRDGRAGMWAWLPHGRSLPGDDWRRRHQAILVLLAWHAVGLFVFGLYMGELWQHAALEASVVALLAAMAALPVLSKRIRGVLAGAGLMTASAILTHFSGGYIEAHFHFFVMMAVVALYEDWVPFLLSILYVAVHHGVLGTIEPQSVFNHAAALADPWLWAGIHAVFIMGMAVALAFYWRNSERTRAEKEQELRRGEATRLESLRRQHEITSLKAMHAARTEFVSLAAHELRTPLGPMKAELYLLRDAADLLEPDHRQSLDSLEENLNRMSRFVNDLLHVARMERGQFQLELAPVDLRSILEATVRLYTPVAEAAGVTLAAGPLQRCVIEADPHRLEQVFMNLVGNGVKATPKGGSVTASVEVTDEAVVRIRDTGIGLEPEEREKLFTPFSQVGNPEGGTGLGLYICKSLVELHGGTITCESAGRDRGSTFIVRLPLATVQEDAVASR